MVGYAHGPGGHRMSNDAQIARCITLLERQGEDIADIKRGVAAQNGRVRKLEKQMDQIRTIWVALTVVVGFFAESIRRKLGLP